jgi:micrococcal nuclease
MLSLFTIAFLCAPGLLVAGLINPKYAFFNQRQRATRAEAVLFSGLFGLVSLIGIGMTAENPTNGNQSVAKLVASSTHQPDEGQKHLEPVPAKSAAYEAAQENRATDQRSLEDAQQLAIRQQTTVISVGDGDTLRVNRGGEAITIRLACVDAPETAQAYGAAATNRLRALLPAGQAVTLQPVDTDRYGRTVAEVLVNGTSVGQQLVQEGYAVVYREYLDNCGASRQALLKAEADARAAGLNFWSQAQPVLPKDFRRGEPSSPAPRPQPTASPPDANASSNLPACVSEDCDCGDFVRWAQTVLEAFPGDPHRLDGDHDGIACERLQ